MFTRNTAGDLSSGWSQVAKPTVVQQRATATANDYFGSSVSIDGDTIVVGAWVEELTLSGAAYVFTRTTPGNLASGWTLRATLVADDRAPGDKFGRSVSIDSDTIVVGADGDQPPYDPRTCSRATRPVTSAPAGRSATS